MQKIKKILLSFFVICLISSFFFLRAFFEYPNRIGGKGNLKKVRHLTKDIYLLATGSSSFSSISIFKLSVAYDDDFISKDIIRHLDFKTGGDSYMITQIAATPDGSHFFVGVDDNMLVFSGRYLDLRKKIKSKEFGLQSKTVFSHYLVCSSNNLWFPNYLDSRNHYENFFKWNFLLPPIKAQKTDLIFEGGENFAYITTGPEHALKSTKIFSLVNGPREIPQPPIFKSWSYSWNYRNVDYDKNGWLLSSTRFPKKQNILEGLIKRRKSFHNLWIIDENTYKELPEGINAVWGADNYIYYVAPSSSLMKLNPGTMKAEIIYGPTEKPCWEEYDDLDTPIVSANREFLLYRYYIRSRTNPRNRDSIIVIFDLIRKEYRKLKSEGRFLENFCFLTRDNSEKESHGAKTGAELKSNPKPSTEQKQPPAK